jgi:hypothetical protein
MKLNKMEKRRSLRKELNPRDAKITCHDLFYRGVIENMSAHGLFVITVSWEHVTSFIPEAVFEIEIQSGANEKYILLCEVRWLHINKTPFYGYTYRMGVDILPQSPGYDDYMFNLSRTTSMIGNG